jgi:hypothetical protein
MRKEDSPQRHRDTRDTEEKEAQRMKRNKNVIPAKAGIHLAGNTLVDGWIPAFAGMTMFE